MSDPVSIKIGDVLEFVYHEKPRRGKVDNIKSTYLTLQLENREVGESEFKTFKFEKIQFLKRIRK